MSDMRPRYGPHPSLMEEKSGETRRMDDQDSNLVTSAENYNQSHRCRSSCKCVKCITGSYCPRVV